MFSYVLLCFIRLACFSVFFFSSRRRHTRCALVTGVQTCALPISPFFRLRHRGRGARLCRRRHARAQFPRSARETRAPLSVQRTQGRRAGCRLPANRRRCAAERSHRADRRNRRRSEEHTSELQSLMRISYAVFCLTKKKNNKNTND